MSCCCLYIQNRPAGIPSRPPCARARAQARSLSLQHPCINKKWARKPIQKRRKYSKKLQPEQWKDALRDAYPSFFSEPSIRSKATASPGSSSRHCPRRRKGGRRNGPKRTRIRRLTGSPSASNIRLTSLLRPSRSTTRYQRFDPVPPPGSMLSNLAGPSSSMTPRASDRSCSRESSPRTRTAYSRSISLLGCMRRLASSPESVKSSRPPVLKSSLPIAIQWPPGRLVIDEHTGSAFPEPQRDRSPVKHDSIGRADPLPQRGAHAVDPEPAGGNRGFHVAARAQPRARQDLVQLFGRRREARPGSAGPLRAGRARAAERAAGSA